MGDSLSSRGRASQASAPPAAPQRTAEVRCEAVPAGSYLFRVCARARGDAPGSRLSLDCVVDGAKVAGRELTLAPGFHAVDCPFVLTRAADVQLLVTHDEGVEAWPPAGPMLAKGEELPVARGLYPAVETVRTWSLRTEGWTPPAPGPAVPPRLQLPRSPAALKELVFTAIYRRIEHRPVPLAMARLTRRGLRVVVAPVRRLGRDRSGE